MCLSLCQCKAGQYTGTRTPESPARALVSLCFHFPVLVAVAQELVALGWLVLQTLAGSCAMSNHSVCHESKLPYP